MTITDRTLLNRTVTTGAPVVVRVDLSNFDPVRGRITLSLAANDTLVAQRSVAVGIDAERTVYLRTRFDSPGRYALDLDGVPVGTVSVRAAGTGTPPATPTPEPPSGTGTPTQSRGTPADVTERPQPTGVPEPSTEPSGTGTSAAVPDDLTGTDVVIATGMSLLLLYGVGVAVYVLREHPPERRG